MKTDPAAMRIGLKKKTDMVATSVGAQEEDRCGSNECRSTRRMIDPAATRIDARQQQEEDQHGSDECRLTREEDEDLVYKQATTTIRNFPLGADDNNWPVECVPGI